MSGLHFPVVGTGRSACGARLTRTNCVRAVDADPDTFEGCPDCKAQLDAQALGRAQKAQVLEMLARIVAELPAEQQAWFRATEDSWIETGLTALSTCGGEFAAALRRQLLAYMQMRTEGKIK